MATSHRSVVIEVVSTYHTILATQPKSLAHCGVMPMPDKPTVCMWASPGMLKYEVVMAWRFVLSDLCCGSVDVGRTLGGGWLSIGLGGTLNWSTWVLVLLAWAVDRDLNGDLATLDLLAVHVVACLLLQLLTSERNEAEATTLARLVACLELADHELGDRSKGNLGGGWVVVGEDLEKLGNGQ